MAAMTESEPHRQTNRRSEEPQRSQDEAEAWQERDDTFLESMRKVPGNEISPDCGGEDVRDIKAGKPSWERLVTW